MAAPTRGKAGRRGCLRPGGGRRGAAGGRGDARGAAGKGPRAPVTAATRAPLSQVQGAGTEGTLGHLGRPRPHLASQPFIGSRDGHSFICSLSTSECRAQGRAGAGDPKRTPNTADKSPPPQARLSVGQVDSGAGRRERQSVMAAGGRKHGSAGCPTPSGGRTAGPGTCVSAKAPQEPDLAQTLTTCEASGSDS